MPVELWLAAPAPPLVVGAGVVDAPEEAELDEPEALGVGDAVAAQDADVGTSTLLALHRLLAVLMMVSCS